jgi:putative transcriptional regulator
MDEELFEELAESIKEAGAYLRGEAKAAGVSFVLEPDPKEIREHLSLTQEAFAELLAISVRTLQNWEQGRRQPSGPAMRLLQIAAKHPEALLDTATFAKA